MGIIAEGKNEKNEISGTNFFGENKKNLGFKVNTNFRSWRVYFRSWRGFRGLRKLDKEMNLK